MCVITHQKHLAQSGHSTRSAVDIFNTLRIFAKEPIRGQEIKLECMNIDRSIFFKSIICKMDKISLLFKIKSCCTHRVILPRRIQLSPSWIGNQALQSYLLQHTPLVNWFQRYRQLRGCQNNKKQRNCLLCLVIS